MSTPSISDSPKAEAPNGIPHLGPTETAKAAFAKNLVSIVQLVAIPVIIAIGCLFSSLLLIFSPDIAFYPIVAATLGFTVLLGRKTIQSLSQFCTKEKLPNA